MTHAIDCKHNELLDLASLMRPIVVRVLPGQTQPEETVRVDVHVRSYEDSPALAVQQPVVEPQRGGLPVGTLLDCYM